MHKASVLVVDDQPSILQLERDILELEGHHVLSAPGGHEALQLLQEGDRPDVIVCDLVMPEMDGLELIRRLKADPRLSTVPVIVCSGHPHLCREAFDAGAEAFFRKPFTSRVLLELVERCVQGGGSTEAMDAPA
jgi:CheY-like chemotaxis protein